MVLVEWDASALSRHEEWALSIALEYTPRHAISYFNDIQNSITNISNNPLIGTEFSSPVRSRLRRLVTGHGYSIFYELDSLDEPTKALIISVIRGSS